MTLRPLLLAWLLACAPQPDDTAIDSDTDGGTPVVDGVETGPEQVCAAPSARTTLGPLTRPVSSPDWDAQPFDSDHRTLFTGGGLAVADVDGDGRLDLLLADEVAPQLYLQAADGALVQASDRLPALTAVTAITPVDLDADGDADLLVARFGAAPSLLRNDGTGRFVEDTEAWGLGALPEGRYAGASVVDLDRDGDLDVLVPGHGGLRGAYREPGDPSLLLLRGDDGRMTDVSERLPQRFHDAYTFVAGWHDLDDDGWLDLYGVSDYGNLQPSMLLWNRQGALVPDDGAAGLDVAIQGMGLGVGDLDSDGALDVISAGWGNNRLMLARQGAWFDAHDAWGLDGDRTRGQTVGWATQTGDLDNDGDLDVVEGFGHIYNQTTPPNEPDEVFLNQGDHLQPVGAAWGFDHPGQTRGLLVVDVNRDGWLDLLRRDLVGPATLQLGRCDGSSWVGLRLRDPSTANRDGIGAKVTVRAGDRTWTRTVDAGSTSVLAGGPPEVHVGLGAVQTVDEVIVRWPDGASTRYVGVAVRRWSTLHREAP